MGTGHRVELQPAFVLHRRPYRETSLLIELFARGAGRVGVIAKGARRPRSPLRALMQPFWPLLVSWSGRGELGVVTAAETDGPRPGMDGAALLHGLYVNELLMRLLHRHDPHPELFDGYRAALAHLAADWPVEPVLRVFEKNLLDNIGYGLVLEHEADTGRPIEAAETYRYRPDVGPVPAAPGSRVPGGEVEVSGATLLGLARGDIGDATRLREAKRLMRCAIETLLGGRPLASRALFSTPTYPHRMPGAAAAVAEPNDE